MRLRKWKSPIYSICMKRISSSKQWFCFYLLEAVNWSNSPSFYTFLSCFHSILAQLTVYIFFPTSHPFFPRLQFNQDFFSCVSLSNNSFNFPSCNCFVNKLPFIVLVSKYTENTQSAENTPQNTSFVLITHFCIQFALSYCTFIPDPISLCFTKHTS